VFTREHPNRLRWSLAVTAFVTVVALGRRCFCVPSIPDALRVRRRLDEALLGGLIGGVLAMLGGRYVTGSSPFHRHAAAV